MRIKQSVQALSSRKTNGKETLLCLSLLLTPLMSDDEQTVLMLHKPERRTVKNEGEREFLTSSSVWPNRFLGNQGNEFNSSLLALRWVLTNAEDLKFEGITAILLDSLAGARIEDTQEIVSILEILRGCKLTLFVLDMDSKMIYLDTNADMISSGKYLDIVVVGLIGENGASSVFKKQVELPSKTEPISLISAFKLHPMSPATEIAGDKVVRFPVWIEQHPDGSIRFARM